MISCYCCCPLCGSIPNQVTILQFYRRCRQLSEFQPSTASGCQTQILVLHLLEVEIRDLAHTWMSCFRCWRIPRSRTKLFAKNCLKFVTDAGIGMNHQGPGALVACRYSNWQHALENFGNHQKIEYHQVFIMKMENLIKQQRQEMELISWFRLKQNRTRLSQITETIILCGLQCLTRRRHWRIQ